MECKELFIFENGQPLTTPPPQVSFWAFRLTVLILCFLILNIFSICFVFHSKFGYIMLFHNLVFTNKDTFLFCDWVTSKDLGKP